MSETIRGGITRYDLLTVMKLAIRSGRLNLCDEVHYMSAEQLQEWVTRLTYPDEVMVPQDICLSLDRAVHDIDCVAMRDALDRLHTRFGMPDEEYETAMCWVSDETVLKAFRKLNANCNTGDMIVQSPKTHAMPRTRILSILETVKQKLISESFWVVVRYYGRNPKMQVEVPLNKDGSFTCKRVTMMP